MVKPRRILVLTLSFGSGHVRAAETIAGELLLQAPGAEVRIMDALDHCRYLFRAGYVWPYWLMVRYAPALWNRFFSRRLKRLHRCTAPEWAFRFGCPRVFKVISAFKPDTIVATEVAACEMAAIARRNGLTNARIVSVITDYESEPAWVQREVDIYAVADEQVSDQLRVWGAPLASSVVCGIPTEPAFLAPHDVKSIRAKYNLNDAAPIVLIMGGGMGPSDMDEVAAFLLESGQRMQIVAVTGGDQRARRHLNRLQPLPNTTVRVLGWTDDVPSLMQSASVLITKPGGLTTAEAAVSELPLVICGAIPGPEQRNAERIAESGAGLLTNNAREAAVAALAILNDETARQRMSASAKQLARPDAAARIARLVLNEGGAEERLARTRTA